MSDKKFLDQSGLNYVWQKIKSNDTWERGSGDESVQVIGGNASGAFSVSEGIVYEIEKLITIQHIVPGSDIDKYVISTLGSRFNYYCEYTFSEDINGNSIPSLISSGQIHEIIGDDQISEEPLCNITGEFLLDNDISDDIASLFRLSRLYNGSSYSSIPEFLKEKNILVFNLDTEVYLDTNKQYVLKCNTGVGTNGLAAHNEGFFTLSDNVGSHSEGFNTVSNANGAHSEGLMTVSKEIGAHSEGILNISSGIASHAEGAGTIASADYSHAEGYKTIAKGYTHYNPNASTSNSAVIGVGLGSHAEGVCTIASGIGSHAEGYKTESLGNNAHAEGYLTTANGDSSHAEGVRTVAKGPYSHTEGYESKANKTGAHAEGYLTTANGDFSHAEGVSTIAQGRYSHAEGEGQTHEYIFKQISENRYECISGVESNTSTEENKIFYLRPGMLFRHYYQQSGITMPEFLYIQSINISDNVNEVEFNAIFTDTGDPSIVTELVLGISYGDKSHTEGTTNISFGGFSHAEGIANRSIGSGSHTEGSENTVFSISGHAEGHGNIIEQQAIYSHAEGVLNNVGGSYAHAEGSNNIASGYASHAEGYKTVANTNYSHAQGKYNVSNFGNITSEQTLSSIGIGTGYTDENGIFIEDRKNAVEVMQNGDIYLIGVGDYDGTNAVNPNSEGKTGQPLQSIVVNKAITFAEIDAAIVSAEDIYKNNNYQVTIPE